MPKTKYTEEDLDNLWDKINELGDNVFGKLPRKEWNLAHKLFDIPVKYLEKDK